MSYAGMRRDRRRQKQGERLGAILGLLTGGLGGFLKQVQAREAADLEAAKERRMAARDAAELDLGERKLRGESNRAWQAAKRDELKMGFDRTRERRMQESAEARERESEARIKKIEHDILNPKKPTARAKTALDFEAESVLSDSGGDTGKAIESLLKQIKQAQSGFDALSADPFAAEGAAQTLGRSRQLHGWMLNREQQSRPDILGSGDFQITRNYEMPGQQQAPGQMGPPSPFGMGQQQGPGFDMQSDLVGALLDAYNPQNPPERRMMGMAKLRQYLGPDAVLQSFKNQMGGPPVPPQMPR